MRAAAFVDTGAWIALALTGDPYHDRARAAWLDLLATATRLVTSVPVAIETFTFLDRNANRDVAKAWRDQVTSMRTLQIVECTLADLTRAWLWFEQRDLVRLSVVDATSFVLMGRLKIRRAFAFDQHFARAGFTLIG
ncbi:MAG: PIN domain-containing protein [Planctomycetota bacterium]